MLLQNTYDNMTLINKTRLLFQFLNSLYYIPTKYKFLLESKYCPLPVIEGIWSIFSRLNTI